MTAPTIRQRAKIVALALINNDCATCIGVIATVIAGVVAAFALLYGLFKFNDYMINIGILPVIPQAIHSAPFYMIAEAIIVFVVCVIIVIIINSYEQVKTQVDNEIKKINVQTYGSIIQ